MKKTSLLEILLDFFEIVFTGTAIFLVVYFFVGQLLEVTGESMYPTFHDKEQILAEKVSVKFKKLERGEIVIFKQPEKTERLLIKRVIGLPGEKIKVEDGNVYVNGQMLSEPYLPSGTYTNVDKTIQEGIEYQIPYNAYIFMGDNREKSTDSRNWGAVDQNLVLGRGILVYYPLNRSRFIGNGL